MVTFKDFIHRQKRLPHLVQRNRQHHRKEPLRNFHLSGHTLGFYLQTQKSLKSCNHLVQRNKQYQRKVLHSSDCHIIANNLKHLIYELKDWNYLM